LRYLDKLQPLALLILRLVLGIIMIGHGYSKVFGGLHHHVQMVSSLGLPGLFTRFAALAIAINMVVAIVKVHWHNGLLGNGGYQFPLALASIAFALIFLGAGPIALEGLRGGVGSGRSPK
jgi:putative oxidoreductase